MAPILPVTLQEVMTKQQSFTRSIWACVWTYVCACVFVYVFVFVVSIHSIHTSPLSHSNLLPFFHICVFLSFLALALAVIVRLKVCFLQRKAAMRTLLHPPLCFHSLPLSYSSSLSFLSLIVPFKPHSPFFLSPFCSYFIWLVTCDVVTAARQKGFCCLSLRKFVRILSLVWIHQFLAGFLLVM